MSDPIHHDLLGFLCDALEPRERELIERRLGNDPALAAELESLRGDLELFGSPAPCEPPPNLAARTCRFVAEQSAQPEHQLATPVGKSPAADLLAPTSSWRLLDAAVAIAICVAGLALVFPLIQSSRASAQVTACANRLREIGLALTGYSEHHRGAFPEVPETGKLAAAGIYAPVLLDAGYLTNRQVVVCPGSPLASESKAVIPTLVELQTADGARLAELRHGMGGSYGYALGYRDRGVYKGERNLHCANFAVMADLPAGNCKTSSNHGGTGHNVLLEDGHVVYLHGCRLDGSTDDIFTNDLGQLAAGCQVNDAVVAPSDVAP